MAKYVIGIICNRGGCNEGKLRQYTPETAEETIKEIKEEAMKERWFINDTYTFCPRHNDYNKKY